MTKLNAVKAVNEMAQPIAIGAFAQKPIKIEPSPATKQVAINTDSAGKPASPAFWAQQSRNTPWLRRWLNPQ